MLRGFCYLKINLLTSTKIQLNKATPLLYVIPQLQAEKIISKNILFMTFTVPADTMICILAPDSKN